MTIIRLKTVKILKDLRFEKLNDSDIMKIYRKLECRRSQNEDVSDDLDQMSYAEKFILNKETLDALSSLGTSEKITENGVEMLTDALVVDREDLPGYQGEFISGAATKLNQVFYHMRIPFVTSAYTSKDAPTIIKKRTKGKDKDTEYSVKPADKLRIIKTGDEFNIDNYSVEGSSKLKPFSKNGEIITPAAYGEPTEGMKLRIDRWLNENATECADALEKLGLEAQE